MDAKVLIALSLTGAVALWMVSGTLVVSGATDEAAVRPPAERAEADAGPYRVRARVAEAVDRARTLTMRGRTRADAIVAVASETLGQIVERPVGRGSRVDVGDVMCRLDPGVRQAQLDQAEAEMRRAELENTAASKLLGRGYESEVRVAETFAVLDAARALVAAARLELSRTTIVSPVEGVVQEPIADVGSTLAVGDVCATVVDADPIVVTGQVSERDVTDVRTGISAAISLQTGETVEGTISFVSRTAAPETRTFTVELTVDNPDRLLRDGVTAETAIPLEPVRVHRLSPGVLTLSDEGEVGVRVVDESSTVRFMPVAIAMQDTDGFWVTGLPDRVTIITVGQDYVVEGQPVEPVLADPTT